MTALNLETIRAARDTISSIAQETPLLPSHFLSTFCGVEMLLKLETMQPTGAFKLRGAANALANLPDGVAGVACASTGNHGRAVAFAAARMGLRAVICMTNMVPEVKLSATRALGAEVRIAGTSQDDAQAEVDRLVAREGLHDISPFDDPFVIAGQGTVALELLDRRPDLQTIILPLSGGGLAAGIALAARAINPGIRVIGVTMETGAAMHASIRAGHPVEVVEEPSLADALGGGIFQDNRLTLDLCTRLLDDTILVSEAEIYTAMQTLFFEERLVAEGSGAVGLAALLAGRIGGLAGPAALVLSGRNVDPNRFADIIAGRDIRLGNTLVKGHSYGHA